MTNDEKELMRDLINQASNKVELLQKTVIEKDAEISELKAKIKQAKIDVLKELRERIETAIDTYYNSDGGGYYLAEDVLDDIDLLIEEVEKQ